jgi:hypothetical protein
MMVVEFAVQNRFAACPRGKPKLTHARDLWRSLVRGD